MPRIGIIGPTIFSERNAEPRPRTRRDAMWREGNIDSIAVTTQTVTNSLTATIVSARRRAAHPWPVVRLAMPRPEIVIRV
jgi:hypothetical protein